ncbi:hypothetical protein I302_103698 [Kwoniella bestiolae CBS 10118]|uniref:MICOS complex subunit MIC12 n=1 Tax=Kwoniella bestiolae CBS 10118 TaxID=1296100 RepID=A0A1B9G990_9TREE|nr:hypothetical protein I302_02403 [Kwoniella bestiolae CBS 10118]OCF27561.1 hypothetical protein I302_02403 [Kwoniella bestiolae CBS 10118]
MSGFILGTGSGILASAAVYYTLSTSLKESTAGLRSELHNSSQLLSNSFEPIAPPAPSSLIGPSSTSPYQPSFGETVKQRWNATLTSLVSGVRSTDWELVGKDIYQVGENAVKRLSESTPTPNTVGNVPSLLENGSPVKETVKAHSTVSVVPGTTGIIDEVEKVPEEKVGVNKVDGVDLRRDRYGHVQGNELKELIKRSAEKEGKRLV